jgi:hypothetical protein
MRFEGPRGSRLPWLALLIVVVVAAAAIWFFFLAPR